VKATQTGIHWSQVQVLVGPPEKQTLISNGGGMVAMADGSSSAFNGPVFKLIGIYSGRINKESDMGIVWRTSAIAELVKTL
jgi:hypothetical protein